MQDNGGWEHKVSTKIQISPNGKQYIVLYLWIDGQNYVMNQPRETPSASSESSEYQEALKEAQELNGQTVEEANSSSNPESLTPAEQEQQLVGNLQ